MAQGHRIALVTVANVGIGSPSSRVLVGCAWPWTDRTNCFRRVRRR